MQLQNVWCSQCCLTRTFREPESSSVIMSTWVNSLWFPSLLDAYFIIAVCWCLQKLGCFIIIKIQWLLCWRETDIFVSNNHLKWHLIVLCNHCECMLVPPYLNISASAYDVHPLSPAGATAMSERNPAIIARQGLAVSVRWKSEKRAKQREVQGESVRSTHTWLQLICSGCIRCVIMHFLL